MDIVLNYFLNAFNNSVNLFYFFCLMFCCELIKMLGFFKYDDNIKSYYYKFKDKIYYYNFKWVVLIIGFVLGVIFYFAETSPQVNVDLKSTGHIILRIFLTFSITLTLYDYFFQLVIMKFKQILSTLIKATVKPVSIDLGNVPNVDSVESVDGNQIKIDEPPLG